MAIIQFMRKIQIKEIGQTCLNTALDIIYPRNCVSCRRTMPSEEKGFLCSDCYSRLRLIENYCEKCAAEVNQFANVSKGCQLCRYERFAFSGAVAAVRYDGIARNILHSFKFGKEKVAGIPLSNLLIDALRGASFISKISLIVSVPLSKKHFHERGFNQAEFLAHRVAKAFELPASYSNLIRIKETPPQAQLQPEKRRVNVKSAFAVKRPAEFSNKTILIIDDVMTTGSTISECASTLKKAGASRIYAAVVERLKV
ncbi:MAG: ComF family protein [Planctomycetota bacterium]